MHAIWELILCDAWRVNAGTELELIQRSVMAFKGELLRWYPTVSHVSTRIEDFLPAMLGKKNQRCLSVKASEGKGLFYFICVTLDRYKASIHRGDLWAACATSLRESHDVMNAAALKPSFEACMDYRGNHAPAN